MMKGRIVKIDGKYQVCSFKTGNPLARKYDSKKEAMTARKELRANHYAPKSQEEE